MDGCGRGFWGRGGGGGGVGVGDDCRDLKDRIGAKGLRFFDQPVSRLTSPLNNPVRTDSAAHQGASVNTTVVFFSLSFGAAHTLPIGIDAMQPSPHFLFAYACHRQRLSPARWSAFLLH